MTTDDKSLSKIDPLEEATGRLLMAKTAYKFLLEAYDALLHHGVNFKSLPEWQQDYDRLDEIAKLPFKRGVQEYISWMGRVSNAVRAKVRRKGFHVVAAVEEPEV